MAPNAQQMNLRTHVNAPTTIPDLTVSKHQYFSPESGPSSKTVNMSPHEPIPYPFMSGFVDRSMGNRFSKRVHFDRSDYDDLLGKIID